MNDAIIFVPPDHPLDREFTIDGLGYLRRRAYSLVAVLREWDTVLRLMREGKASIVVFVRRSHREPTWTEPAEFVEDDEGETRNLDGCYSAQAKMRNDHLLSRARLRPEEVEVALEATGPIPTGLDPQSIRAARRIWRHFNDHGCA